MAMTYEERRAKQREYNRQYYLAHRDRKLEQNARSARRWREKYPERYRLSQERCRARARELRGAIPRRPRLRECVVCHDVREHKAREMCVVCYGKWRWQNHKHIIESYIESNPQAAAELGIAFRR
jgi:hypothetical protein